jgi:hypothetical protein
MGAIGLGNSTVRRSGVRAEASRIRRQETDTEQIDRSTNRQIEGHQITGQRDLVCSICRSANLSICK